MEAVAAAAAVPVQNAEKAVPMTKHRKLSESEERHMIRTTVQIDGMMCGMCETHIQDAIRKHFKVKKVNASRSKGEAEIISEEALDEMSLKKVIAETGYDVGAVASAPYEKKKLFGKK